MAHRYDTMGDWRIHVRFTSADPAAPRPPVVLVHGLVISSRYMVPLARHLGPHAAVHAPDLPGFGRSDKPPHTLTVPEHADALAAWMQHNGLEGAPLVGNSFGCQVILDLAARHPQMVGRIVLVGPTMDPAAGPMGQVLRLVRDMPREGPALWLLHVPDYLRAGLRRAYRTYRYAIEDPVRIKLPRVQTPALVVRGERDPIVSQAWAEEVADTLPDGRLVVLPGGPHALNYSRPRQLMDTILPFLWSETDAPP